MEKDLRIMQNITKLDDATRAEIADKVDAEGLSLWTCLGDGLKKGLEALRDYNGGEGGVMIYLTDGDFACNYNANTCTNCDPSHPISWAIDDVVKQGVKVVTVAFGQKADPFIEDLAEETGGAAYFVPDGTGPGEINRALAGCLDYQPDQKGEEQTVVLLQETVTEVA